MWFQVKNFILLGDIHKSIYFLSWKEQGSQLNLLAKDFGSLDCFATEFLIDGSTLSLIVSDEQKNVQVRSLTMLVEFICSCLTKVRLGHSLCLSLLLGMLKRMRFLKIIPALSRFLLIWDSHHDVNCL